MADAIVRTLWREIYQPRAPAGMGDHGAIGDCGRTALPAVRSISLRLVANLAAFSLFRGSASGARAAGLRSLDYRAPGGRMAERAACRRPAAITPKDRDFLRDTALRTWRYFADHSREEQHWLVPDNVQENPSLVTHHISPTNLGLSLTAQLAAHDFGYLNLDELSSSVQRIFDSLEEMPRYRGHFFNWYETSTRRPLTPQYVSTRGQRKPGRFACDAAPGLSAVAQAADPGPGHHRRAAGSRAAAAR